MRSIFWCCCLGLLSATVLGQPSQAYAQWVMVGPVYTDDGTITTEDYMLPGREYLEPTYLEDDGFITLEDQIALDAYMANMLIYAGEPSDVTSDGDYRNGDNTVPSSTTDVEIAYPDGIILPADPFLLQQLYESTMSDEDFSSW